MTLQQPVFVESGLEVGLGSESQNFCFVQRLVDFFRQRLARNHAFVTSSPILNRSFADCLPCIVRGTDHAARSVHPCVPMSSPCGDRSGSAHRLDLRFGKRISPSNWAMRIPSSSLTISRFLTSRLARLVSGSRASTLWTSVHQFSAATPPSRNSSRHLNSAAAGWQISLLSGTMLWPRSSRNITFCFRFADQRFIDDFLLMGASYCSRSINKCVFSLFGRQYISLTMRDFQ